MNRQYEIGYKVVMYEDKKLMSYMRTFDYPIFKKNAIQYRLRRWSIPKINCGPLAVFLHIIDVVHFLSHEPQYRLCQCKVYECKCQLLRIKMRSLWAGLTGNPFDKIISLSNVSFDLNN